MAAILREPLPIELRSTMPRPADRESTHRLAAMAVGVLGCLCMLPYPAIPVGGYSAIQMGNIVTLLMALPLLAVAWRARPFWLYLCILTPLCISALPVAFTGGGDIAQCLRSIDVWAISCLTVVVAQWYAPRHALSLLTGIAVATIIHAAVGTWQAYAFASGEFPFVGLYVNPSFLSVQDNAQVIARYTQRPFGIFPEPSAMSCSLAPWVLFWFAQLFGVVRLRQTPAGWQRIVFAVAAVAGIGLIILSRSGHTLVTLAAILLFALVWLLRCKATFETYLKLVLSFGAVLPTGLWLATVALSDRTSVENGSWQDRSDSMVVGLGLLVRGDWRTIMFGLGAGMSAPAIQQLTGFEAVWSVSLTYLYETGMVGLIAISIGGLYLVRVWHSIRYHAAFAAIAVVWLVGITITTSYEQLLPLWLTLGWLTVWPEICQTPTPSRWRALQQPPAGERSLALSEEDQWRLT